MSYFKHRSLLVPPVKRAAYSDRTAWLMAVMSSLTYLKFEQNEGELKTALTEAQFELVQCFTVNDTQAYLAKRESDKMAVLAFRGTEMQVAQDIGTDLKIKFYEDKNNVKIHDGFYRAFKCVEPGIKERVASLKDHSLYVTGHSLGGALALIATRALNSDNLAACYTFGSPKVGNVEFGYEIKPPIYRIVNAHDIVPFSPPTYLFDLMCWLPWKKVCDFAKKFVGYAHHGDMRYLTPCGDDFKDLKLIENYNEINRLVGSWKDRKQTVKDHAIDLYCEKLAQWALKRLNEE